jgi:GNAT superfamily N-acetyltransferase
MDFQIVEANLRHAMRCFSQASKLGEVRESDGIWIASCGMDYGVFNSAMLSEPVTGGAPELGRRIAVPEVHFQSRELRWSFWVCEDLIDRAFRKKARDTFFDRGFRMLVEPPGMLAERLRPTLRKLPAMKMCAVDSLSTRQQFAHLMSICFELPFPAACDIYQSEGPWKQGMQGFLGYVDGVAVSAAAVVVAADAIGLYAVATLPDQRGKGYAEATIRFAVGQASAATGIERTVLQSTHAGMDLYRRMGYRAVTRFWVMLPY